jgi:hypothetical protein
LLEPGQDLEDGRAARGRGLRRQPNLLVDVVHDQVIGSAATRRLASVPSPVAAIRKAGTTGK